MLDDIITIDGPSGVGKGTLAMSIAQRLKWNYLNSGSIYRILAHLSEIQKVSQSESLPIDKNTDYSTYSGLSSEAVEKLSLVKPETLGQACRISGVSPADASVLMVYLFKQ